MRRLLMALSCGVIASCSAPPEPEAADIAANPDLTETAMSEETVETADTTEDDSEEVAEAAVENVARPLIGEGDVTKTADGRCFARDPGPDQFRTARRSVITAPATFNADGSVRTEAVFRNEDVQVKIDNPNPTPFETLCPEAYTVELVSNLQRAMSVRGRYKGPITGEFDRRTRSALLAAQRDNGINSPYISIENARGLGLVPVDLTEDL